MTLFIGYATAAASVNTHGSPWYLSVLLVLSIGAAAVFVVTGTIYIFKIIIIRMRESTGTFPIRSKAKIITYTRQALMEGVTVFVPPKTALIIPLTVEKGEVIAGIGIRTLDVPGVTENYIDTGLFDSNKKEVFSFQWNRNFSRGFGGAIPAGQYTLLLSNEYQPSFEKKLEVTVHWKPAPIIPQGELSDFRIIPSTSRKADHQA